MSRYRDAAQTFTDLLGLSEPPIAVAFAETAPAGVAPFASHAPSACAIWRLAETHTFYASAADHAACPVGAHVMGFALSPETALALTTTAGTMLEAGYMAAEEMSHLPRVAEAHGGIVYGPLADFPVAAEAALLWVNPAQAMLLEESIGALRWPVAREHAYLFGRPACGALAVAVNTGHATRSVGCAGMRTFTKMPGDMSPIVLAGGEIDAVAGRLTSVHAANEQMLAHYQRQQLAFDLAERARG